MGLLQVQQIHSTYPPSRLSSPPLTLKQIKIQLTNMKTQLFKMQVNFWGGTSTNTL